MFSASRLDIRTSTRFGKQLRDGPQRMSSVGTVYGLQDGSTAYDCTKFRTHLSERRVRLTFKAKLGLGSFIPQANGFPCLLGIITKFELGSQPVASLLNYGLYK